MSRHAVSHGKCEQASGISAFESFHLPGGACSVNENFSNLSSQFGGGSKG